MKILFCGVVVIGALVVLGKALPAEETQPQVIQVVQVDNGPAVDRVKRQNILAALLGGALGAPGYGGYGGYGGHGGYGGYGGHGYGHGGLGNYGGYGGHRYGNYGLGGYGGPGGHGYGYY